MKAFAVLDVETTWEDEVMSIGVAVADANSRELIEARYYLLDPEYKKPAMYSGVLVLPGINGAVVDSRANVLDQIKSWLLEMDVERVLAYNACFDKKHLPELDGFVWCDIMRLAAYRQYNSKIPKEVECFKTGRMKSGYGVEAILRMIGPNRYYRETHNAYFDAIDELKIVQLLNQKIEVYDCGIVK